MKTKKGNLLDVTSGVLVHGCNCHGVMGGGIALAIREKWPTVFDAYRRRYVTSGLHLGDVVQVGALRWLNKGWHPSSVTAGVPHDVVVANAMTQFDFGRDPDTVYVNYDAVRAAFSRIRLLALETELPVHFPLIGCGLANGKWDKVSNAIEEGLGQDIEATLWVFP